jgi:transcription antitermination factor NusG
MEVDPDRSEAAEDRAWYAVFTIPQHEKSAHKHLEMLALESFLPTYDSIRIWKNRQRKKVVLPLFPTYLFVRINSRERGKVLHSPGVIQIVGNGRAHVPLPDSEIALLRHGLDTKSIEPYRELVVGERVRIRSGVMQGVQGTLVRRMGYMKFVLTLELINQHAALQVDAKDLEPITS